MVDWTEKYRPSTLAEVRGNNKARDALAEWGKTWDDHREAVVLHGAPGVGKTSAAHALANDMEWPTIELNASDSRTNDVIKRVAGEAAKSGRDRGGGGRRLVIMDEADNIHGNDDRGARALSPVSSRNRTSPSSSSPTSTTICRADSGAPPARSSSGMSARSIVPVLRDLCRQEGVEYESDALQELAEQNSGGLRGAVKDLQAIAETTERLTADDVVTGERDTTEGIFEYLDVVLKEAGAQDALEASYDVDETPDDSSTGSRTRCPRTTRGRTGPCLRVPLER